MTVHPNLPRRAAPKAVLPIMAFAIAGLLLPVVVAAPTYLLWNASASVPLGLYFVMPHAQLRVGDLAVTNLPLDFRTLAAQRHYLPSGVPLIKPVAALSGAQVCRSGTDISIDGQWKARRKSPIASNVLCLSGRDVGN